MPPASIPLRSPPATVFGLALVALATLAAGCAHRGFFTDGTTVSIGRADRGLLREGRELDVAGEGYVIPPLWSARGNNFGTDELVETIRRAAARVADELPGSLLGVGDLSRRGGGRSQFHKSHENGRDADLIFYAVDADGQPLPPPNAMPRYDRKLRSRPPREAGGDPVSPRFFDVARNWALVAALVTDPDATVEYLFVSNPLKQRLLEYAEATHAPYDVVQKAKLALRQPRRALPHDDHLHLRIRCSASDRAQGCVDEGRVRLRVERAPGPPVT